MKRQLVLWVGLAAFWAGAAWGAEDDGLMGIYESALKPAAAPIEVQVIAWEDKAYSAVLVHPETRARYAGTLTGTRADGAVTLTGETTLEGTAVDGRITVRNGRLEGSIGDYAVSGSRVDMRSPTLGMAPPKNGVMLFDGSDLEAWRRHPEKWVLTGDGAMEVAPSQLVTRIAFGDHRLHLEFRCPFMPDDEGQGRGNSGVYVLGRYEVQVLDSFGLEPKSNDCGGIYKQATPSVNACYPPLTWQTYDITFRAPRFDADGTKTENARITVRHNGVVIHDEIELTDVTPGGISGSEAPRGPLMLQDHSDSVQYRNIWVAPRS